MKITNLTTLEDFLSKEFGITFKTDKNVMLTAFDYKTSLVLNKIILKKPNATSISDISNLISKQFPSHPTVKFFYKKSPISENIKLSELSSLSLNQDEPKKQTLETKIILCSKLISESQTYADLDFIVGLMQEIQKNLIDSSELQTEYLNLKKKFDICKERF